MAKKAYGWLEGARLDDHTRRKHKILREYFFRYITVRCQIPQQTKFRLAVVDGFSGGGRYGCGTSGSPLIFIEELQRAIETINVHRAAQGLASLEIECLLLFNDADPDVTELLKTYSEPLLAATRETHPKLHLRVAYMSRPFEEAYPAIRDLITAGAYKSVLFNLDQCGHAQVERSTLLEILRTSPSAEVFYTFAINSLVAFLSRTSPDLLNEQLRPMGLSATDLTAFEEPISNSTWLGLAERLVFQSFLQCAPYVSPFSIHNPDGWRYWLIHFARSYRARQVYNDVLHANSNEQAHFGRSGLNMLSYDPSREGKLYLFDPDGRTSAKAELMSDIPRLISEAGDAMSLSDFYESIYNATPAHSDDIHSAMLDSEELEVLTPSGGERRKANTIRIEDTIRLKVQRTFFPMFGTPPLSKKA